MSSPKPGATVRGSISGAPINALFDLLGRRWALGILWYLGDGPSAFRQLQERCGGISPSILNARLKELRAADIVARTIDGYALTERGAELRSFIVPLANWSADWSKDVYGYERPGMSERLANEHSAKRKLAIKVTD
ncbi:MAG: helix-turn-helix transcriptional regulator [Azonexus sp.]|jgi:DNA-binding HxlR family transcriptional regulator|uniref:winged helix-turn-helix transcriptional regulator n=1 Tax=Azonexus sp. TaxID=1872668 RepID=UPI002826238F|nr:helix-turn-helix domain-containing protein [Azonexus sp.]MDR0776865.1 helix-turn-helix transcriptional regulator [Azonexus sp.]